MFQLTFTSWENEFNSDGSLKKTFKDTYLIVRSEYDLNFVTELSSKFKCGKGNPGKLGNATHNEDFLIGVITELLEKHPNVSRDLSEKFLMPDWVFEYLYLYIIGYPVNFNTGFCRVISNVSSRKIRVGSLLKRSKDLKDVVFVGVADNEMIDVREAEHLEEDGIPNIYSLTWQLKSLPLADLNFEYFNSPTKASKLVARI